jgi:sortase (surface protein transpeptidase)
MQKTVFLTLFLVAGVVLLFPHSESGASVLLAYEKTPSPLPPDAGLATTTAVNTLPDATTSVQDSTIVAKPIKQISSAPTRLLIPSIGLNDTVNKVGTNAKGEMDVPAGNTNDVGWYQFGTVPGEIGSAVIDAHVFAAFSKLKNIDVGSSIYIETESGQKLHFVVSEMKMYKLADIPADLLFNRADKARLNLITCAGKLTDDHSTSDKRLVIYATLKDD